MEKIFAELTILFKKIMLYFKTRRTQFFITLSVLFHIFLYLLTLITIPDFFNPDKIEKQKKVMQITLSDQNIAELKKKLKERQSIKQQVVNNDTKMENELRPNDSRFLGEKNQAFDRQTIAKNIDSFNKGGKGTEKGKKVKDMSSAKELSLNDLGLKKSENDDYDKFKKNSRLGSKDSDSNEIGLTANNDFIEDVPIGDTTHLNTVEFKYFGFYDRIRKRLEQYWGVNLKDKAKQMYKKGRALVPGENYITSLKIILDERGNIVSVNVLSTSGQHELDSAAIDSFNSAGPFPNPPKGMLKNGKVELEWGFVVKS